jgi:pyocin large subunit-like protein
VAAWKPESSGPVTPQDLNRYAYALNNPLKYTDPTGHWVERAIDIAFIASDRWDIAQNGLTWENGLALAADVGGLLLPGLTGGGMLVRAAAHADEAADALRAAAHADEAADAARAGAHPSAIHEATGVCSANPNRPAGSGAPSELALSIAATA